jgi:hypothetical protein
VKRPTRITAALAAGAAIALSAPAAPALADGFGLSLRPSAEAVVGKTMTIQASGTIPPADTWAPYWFSLDAISTAVTTTCPADRWEGAQFATANGSIVVLSQSEKPDAAGNFTIPVAITPSSPGSVLLCGYTDDGAATTLAAAGMILNIKPASASRPGTGSGPPSPPEYTRQGVKSCNALMTGADAKSCVRDIVRNASSRCRKLHSKRARTSCLKAVRRAARSR